MAYSVSPGTPFHYYTRKGSSRYDYDEMSHYSERSLIKYLESLEDAQGNLEDDVSLQLFDDVHGQFLDGYQFNRGLPVGQAVHNVFKTRKWWK